MKRITKIMLICCLCAAVLPPLTATAAETTLSSPTLFFNDVSAYKGDTIEIIATLENCPEVKSMAIEPEYDKSRLQYVSGEWLLKGYLLGDWDNDQQNGAILFSSPVNVNGQIAKFVFKINDGESWEDISFACKLVLKNGETTHNVQIEQLSIYVKCDHAWSEQEYTKPATCFEEGYIYKLCPVCKREDIQSTIEKLRHVESDWIIDKEPSDGVEGLQHTECLICKTRLQTQILRVLDKPFPLWAIITICAVGGVLIGVIVFLILYFALIHRRNKRLKSFSDGSK